MSKRSKSLLRTIFEDNEGHIVIWQTPNIPLVLWVLSRIVALPLDGLAKQGFTQLGTAFLFVWAWLELTSGVNYFRKILGLVVLILTIRGYF